MKRNRGDVLVILPTEDVMREYEPSELLLHQVGLDLPSLGTAMVEQWIQKELHWGHPSNQAAFSIHDLLFTALYPETVGGQQVCKLDRADRRALERLMRSFSAEFYLAVIPILEGFNLTDRQLANIDICWLGFTLVLRITH